MDFTGHLAAFGKEGLKELIGAYEAAGGRVWDKMCEHTTERHSASPLKYAFFALRTKSETGNLEEFLARLVQGLTARRGQPRNRPPV